jgi:transposase
MKQRVALQDLMVLSKAVHALLNMLRLIRRQVLFTYPKSKRLRLGCTENYYVCVLVETDETMPLATIKPEETLGIDLGITHVLIDSDGHKVANPRHLKKGLQRLASVLQ